MPRGRAESASPAPSARKSPRAGAQVQKNTSTASPSRLTRGRMGSSGAVPPSPASSTSSKQSAASSTKRGRSVSNKRGAPRKAAISSQEEEEEGEEEEEEEVEEESKQGDDDVESPPAAKGRRGRGAAKPAPKTTPSAKLKTEEKGRSQSREGRLTRTQLQDVETEDDAQGDVTAPVSGRGRGKKAAEQTGKVGRGKSATRKSKSLTEEDHEAEPPTPSGRQSKSATKSKQAKPSTPKGRFGRAAKVEADDAEEEEGDEEEMETEEVVAEEEEEKAKAGTPSKRGRGRKAEVDSSAVEDTKPKRAASRGKRGREKAEPDEEEVPSKSVARSKRGHSAAEKTEEAVAEASTETEKKETPSKPSPSRGKRGRAAVEKPATVEAEAKMETDEAIPAVEDSVEGDKNTSPSGRPRRAATSKPAISEKLKRGSGKAEDTTKTSPGRSHRNQAQTAEAQPEKEVAVAVESESKYEAAAEQEKTESPAEPRSDLPPDAIENDVDLTTEAPAGEKAVDVVPKAAAVPKAQQAKASSEAKPVTLEKESKPTEDSNKMEDESDKVATPEVAEVKEDKPVAPEIQITAAESSPEPTSKASATEQETAEVEQAETVEPMQVPAEEEETPEEPVKTAEKESKTVEEESDENEAPITEPKAPAEVIEVDKAPVTEPKAPAEVIEPVDAVEPVEVLDDEEVADEEDEEEEVADKIADEKGEPVEVLDEEDEPEAQPVEISDDEGNAVDAEQPVDVSDEEEAAPPTNLRPDEKGEPAQPECVSIGDEDEESMDVEEEEEEVEGKKTEEITIIGEDESEEAPAVQVIEDESSEPQVIEDEDPEAHVIQDGDPPLPKAPVIESDDDVEDEDEEMVEESRPDLVPLPDSDSADSSENLSRKRPRDDAEEEAEPITDLEMSSKKARTEAIIEDISADSFTNGTTEPTAISTVYEPSATFTAEDPSSSTGVEEVVPASEPAPKSTADVLKEYVVIEMSDVPAASSAEVEESVAAAAHHHPSESGAVSAENNTSAAELPDQEAVSSACSDNVAEVTAQSQAEPQAQSIPVIPPIIDASSNAPTENHIATSEPGNEDSSSEMDPSVLFGRLFIPNPTIDTDSLDPAKQFSLVSYNVLADCHARRYDYSYADPKAMDIVYRHSRLMDELGYLDSDVVCLQEVGPAYYAQRLLPDMRRLGYEGVYKKRIQDFYDEGSATFYKTSRFALVSSEGCSLKGLIEMDIQASGLNDEIRECVQHYVDHAEVVLLTRLRCNNTDTVLSLGNIHVLYGDGLKPNLQCVQIASAVKELVRRSEDGVCPHILCGDFNSHPESPAYQLTRDGYPSEEMIASLQQSENMKMPDGSMSSLVNHLWGAFQHTSSSFRSCYSTVQGSEPSVTIKMSILEGCVDYIFYSSNTLDTVGVLQAADEASITAQGGAIPSLIYPSDHISLKAILAFK